MSVTPSTSQLSPSTPRSILVVDDDNVVATALRYAIGTSGYRVVVANSGSQALAAIESDPTIDAALVDFEMSPMNGIELCRHMIARQPSSRPFPIWIMTGAFSADRWSAAIKAGAIDLFPKPFEKDRFIGELEMAWRAHLSGRPSIDDGIRLAPV